MAGAIRLISIEKGYDPRDFALFPLGGAGPLHIDALARELGVPTVLVPRLPGITSALGCIIADVRHDFIQHLNKSLDALKGDEIDTIAARHISAGRDLIKKEGITVEQVDVLHEVDVLYEGQTHLFRFPVKCPGFDAREVEREFAVRYKARFDIDLPNIRVVLSNLRTTVFGRRTKPDLGSLGVKTIDQAPATRACLFQRNLGRDKNLSAQLARIRSGDRRASYHRANGHYVGRRARFACARGPAWQHRRRDRVTSVIGTAYGS